MMFSIFVSIPKQKLIIEDTLVTTIGKKIQETEKIAFF